MDYVPFNEQEKKDREAILWHLENGENLWTRENSQAHLTASAWVVSLDREKVLMCWHRIYRSWSWLGGHADGQKDLCAVAIREVREESGLEEVRTISDDIFSLEILTVDGHEKRGKYVSSHLHLNFTYLLEADEREVLHHKDDENAAVAWFGREEAIEKSTEPWFRERIYRKLNDKLALILPQGR